MRIIDAHTHVFPRYADLAVEVMDRCGIECVVTLEWHDGFGENLVQHLASFNAYPDRFIVFGNIDWRRINEPDFGQIAAQQMAQDTLAGMWGLKVYKALGLEYRHPDGSWWRVNEPALDPIWEQAGRLNLPIMWHVADPAAFWQPVNAHNFWNGVLYGEYAWWSYYRKGFPSRDELLAERNEVIARHPHTIFICPHMGSNTDCLDKAADDLEAYPNLYYDLSARIPLLGISARRAAHTREFLLAYPERILFGTDTIYDDTNVPTGMQAQSLYQPGEVSLHGVDPRSCYIETTEAFFRSNIDFLITDRVQEDPPFKRSREGYSIRGINLPAEVCERLLYGNAARLLGLRSASAGRATR